MLKWYTCQALVYMPSLNSCLFYNRYSTSIKLLDLTSRSIVQSLSAERIHDPHVMTVSSDEMLLASEPHEKYFFDRTYIRLTRLFKNGGEFKTLCLSQSVYISPNLDCDNVTSIKFFPDGKKVVATRQGDLNVVEKDCAWLFMYDVPENFERLSVRCDAHKLNVMKQGYSIRPSIRSLSSEHKFSHLYFSQSYRRSLHPRVKKLGYRYRSGFYFV